MLYRLLPSCIISIPVLGGIVPKFSAYITSCKESPISGVMYTVVVIAFAVNSCFAMITLPFNTTLTVSPSTTPLSYKVSSRLSDLNSKLSIISVLRLFSSVAEIL